jgi:hypothetical protein
MAPLTLNAISNQNFSAMRLNLVLKLPLLLTVSMLVARSFSIDGGPQKNTPTSAAKHERVCVRPKQALASKSNGNRNCVCRLARTLAESAVYARCVFLLGVVFL